jgi:hypothetical protein
MDFVIPDHDLLLPKRVLDSTSALFRPMAVCSDDRIAAAPTEAWVRRDASGLFKPP